MSLKLANLLGRETGHIQPPTLTLDPGPIYFYAKVFILTPVYVYA